MWRIIIIALALLWGGASQHVHAQMEGDLVYLQPVSCAGGSDGEVIIEGIGGQGPYLFSIDGCNTYVAPGIFTDLEAGAYVVCILDMKGDTGFFQFNMPEPLPLEYTIIEEVSAVCFEGAGGSLTIRGVEGTAPYAYSLDGSAFQQDETFPNLQAGSYDLRVRDARGCELSAQIGLSQASPIQLIVEEQVGTDCGGGNSGRLRLSAEGGQGNFSYQLDGGSPQANGVFDQLAAGTYSLTITDDSACTEVFDVEVPAWSGWQVEVDAPRLVCEGISDGYIAVEIGGATPPFLYQLGTGTELQSLPVFTGLAQGTYDLRIEDANGCDTLIQVVLEAPEPLVYDIALTPVSCAGFEDGGASVLPSGGTSPYVFYWEGATIPTGAERSGLSAGTHQLLIEDAAGCQLRTTFSLSNPDPLEISILRVEASACGLANGTVELLATGGTGAYTYAVAGQGQSSSLFTSAAAGQNVFEVEDENGCVAEIQVAVPQTGGIEASFNSVPDLNSPIPLESSELRIVNSSTGATRYFWDFGEGTQSQEAEPSHLYTQAGTYEILLIASSENGECADTLVRSLTVLGSEDLVFAPNAFSPNGDGNNDVFTVKGQSLMRAEMTVFDRTGRRVAFSEVFPSSWDGRDLFGKVLPTGVYTYSMRVVLSGGQAIVKGGGFSLIR